MLQNEFFERTGVQLSDTEFACIHNAYMNSDLDKDTFCKLWCTRYKERVRAAKALRAVAIRTQMRKQDLFKSFLKLSYANDKEVPCTELLSVDELTEIASCGIEISYLVGCEPKPIFARKLAFELHKKFGWIPC